MFICEDFRLNKEALFKSDTYFLFLFTFSHEHDSGEYHLNGTPFIAPLKSQPGYNIQVGVNITVE